MTYPFVPSYHDAGPARGPRLAMVWHMAEGGGTVGYLSRANPNGVSVHFVVTFSGIIVQMLPLEHMHTSIRVTDIRLSDDPDGFYGRTAALAVMGAWADIAHGTLGPNHASIAVEVEGFAAAGPNAAQSLAIDRLAAYLGIPSHLGHRDFADYKSCPGKHFPWGLVGGHGPAEDDMKAAKLTYWQRANAKGSRPVHDRSGAVIHTTPAEPTGYPLVGTDGASYVIRLPGDVVGWISMGDVGSISEPGPVGVPCPPAGSGTIKLSLNDETLYEEELP